jgi:hypothetical protein
MTINVIQHDDRFMTFTTVLQWRIFDCVKNDLNDQNLLLATVQSKKHPWKFTYLIFFIVFFYQLANKARNLLFAIQLLNIYSF